ncbi:PITH domain-containing protein 1 isoform X2 [Pyrus x bretschneideri]|uniref:PITH domain-containing protein 1 isoform X2 n=1 Tax=Pyrus x bretschneideri TaxID=225117 RepID=UPI00202EA5E3|nr:PITH domain-containing protein 1 isoform X2 [Pyrus x bretschneideri]XP_048444255.1 PITH domain-containing protein 1 isoform X2 [Pyrus x bretschneideri]
MRVILSYLFTFRRSSGSVVLPIFPFNFNGSMCLILHNLVCMSLSKGLNLSSIFRFTSDVKIKSISVVGGVDGTSPSKMRVFINKEGIDFSDAQGMQAVQEWDLVENFQGTLEYQTRYSKFQNVASITLHFPDSFGGDTTKIEYIGFKGEATKLKRDVVATIVYELRPNPSDHKTKAEGGGLSHIE